MVTEDEDENASSLVADFPAEPTTDQPGNGPDPLLDPDQVTQTSKNSRSEAAETSILFVSDTHLGYENRSKTGRGRTVPWINQISSQETIRQITKIAIDQDVDAIIHTGDIVDHEVDGEILQTADSFLMLISDLEIPVFCIIGSHDQGSTNPQHPDSVDGVRWLKNQVSKGHLTELTTNPTAVLGGSLDAYGISSGNVGINDVGNYESRRWSPSDIAFEASSKGPNVLCLHDGLTPYRGRKADVDLNRLLAKSRVSFDLVLIGDEHHPKQENFTNGYTFETDDGTPVFYTGPAIPISEAYRDRKPFGTELSISAENIASERHYL